jgi:arsenite methyltransferase
LGAEGDKHDFPLPPAGIEEPKDVEMETRDGIRQRYATAAGTSVDPLMKAVTRGCFRYESDELQLVPTGLATASLGCANPVALADLQVGEVVLDLGSGAGLDVLLSARRVGPSGMVYGLDMTDEMLEIALAHQREAGIVNARFLQGYIEAVPFSDASVDVVLSNCVINISTDKQSAFAEMFRVLRPGGRIAIADIVDGQSLSDRRTAAVVEGFECLATALTIHDYNRHLRHVGFGGISMEPLHAVAPGFVSAHVRAVKPAPVSGTPLSSRQKCQS